MKTKICFFLLALFFSMTLVAQPPQKFKYQGVVRDNNGIPMSNKDIALRISLLQGSETGTEVYVEKHNTKTNQLGLFNIDIGSGQAVSGKFSEIDWSRNNYFQKVEIDTTASGINFIYMGTSQFLSVPYALSAENSLNAQHALYSDTALFSYAKGYSGIWVYDNPDMEYTFSTLGYMERDYMIEVWGGGGGGCYYTSDGNTFPLMGGGGGGYAKSILHLPAGFTCSIKVGAGGHSGSYQGVSGGNSSFGTLVSADGGKGPVLEIDLFEEVVTSISIGIGGEGHGQMNINGESAYTYEDSYYGKGGNSPNGGYGGSMDAWRNEDNGIVGVDGGAPGGGGYSKGNGANGRVVVYLP